MQCELVDDRSHLSSQSQFGVEELLSQIPAVPLTVPREASESTTVAALVALQESSPKSTHIAPRDASDVVTAEAPLALREPSSGKIYAPGRLLKTLSLIGSQAFHTRNVSVKHSKSHNSVLATADPEFTDQEQQSSSVSASSSQHLSSSQGSFSVSSRTSATTAQDVWTKNTSLRLVQGLWVGSSPCDVALVEVWTNQIQNRLSRELLAEIEGGWTLEFQHIGKTQRDLQPAVAVTCVEKETKKEVDKFYRSRRWLRVLLKEHRIRFIIFHSVTRLIASAMADKSKDSIVSIHLSSGATSWCGQPLKYKVGPAREIQWCTTGGLLLVDDVVYALTVGHYFTQYHSQCPQTTDSQSSDDSDTESAPIIHDETDSLSSLSATSSTTDLSLEHSEDDWNLERQPTVALLPSSYLAQTSNRFEEVQITYVSSFWQNEGQEREIQVNDWALTSRPVTILPNRDHIGLYIDEHCSIPIEKAYVTLASFVQSDRFISGFLDPVPCSIELGLGLMKVFRVELSCILPVGYSGTWVLYDGRVCGYLTAARSDEAVAYMMSMQETLADIKTSVGAMDVRVLPRDTADRLCLEQIRTREALSTWSTSQSGESQRQISSKPALPHTQLAETLVQARGVGDDCAGSPVRLQVNTRNDGFEMIVSTQQNLRSLNSSKDNDMCSNADTGGQLTVSEDWDEMPTSMMSFQFEQSNFENEQTAVRAAHVRKIERLWRTSYDLSVWPSATSLDRVWSAFWTMLTFPSLFFSLIVLRHHGRSGPFKLHRAVWPPNKSLAITFAGLFSLRADKYSKTAQICINILFLPLTITYIMLAWPFHLWYYSKFRKRFPNLFEQMNDECVQSQEMLMPVTETTTIWDEDTEYDDLIDGHDPDSAGQLYGQQESEFTVNVMADDGGSWRHFYSADPFLFG